MSINQAGQNSGLAEVDDPGSQRNFNLILGSDIEDPFALDDHHLPNRFFAGVAVKQTPGPDSYDLSGLRPQSSRGAQRTQYSENNSQDMFKSHRVILLACSAREVRATHIFYTHIAAFEIRISIGRIICTRDGELASKSSRVLNFCGRT